MNIRAVKLTLFLNYFIFALLLNSVGTVIFNVQNSYGVSESSAAVLEAFKDLSIAVTSFLIASFITRIGVKNAMLLGLGFVSLICLAMPQVPVFWMTKLLFATIGISFALIKVSVLSCISLVTRDPHEHASTMNFIESFFMVGVLSGYFIFSSFVDDNNPAALTWLNVYYVLAALAISAFILLLLTNLDESDFHEFSGAQAETSFPDMLKLCLKPLIYIFIICAFLYVLIEQSIMTWLPTFNSRVLHLPASLSIQMTSILAASTALGRFTAGLILKRVDWYPLLVGCLIATATLVLVILPVAQLSDDHVATGWLDAPLAAFVFPLIGLSLAPIYPAINSVILSSLPKYQHASMSGLIVVFSALGGTTGSIITGTLFEHFDGRTAFYCSLIPITAILFALTLFKRQSDRAEAELIKATA